MANYSHFCCRSGGSNLNAGSVDGGTTVPAAAALVTYTGGDWNATTDVYTAPVGANMTEAVVGRFASLYVDGDAAPTTNQYLVARITAVNAGTRQITLSTSARVLLGTEVATGTGNRSMRIGGAWAGPSGAVGFPLNFLQTQLVNTSSYPTRLDMKNDQTYTVSANVAGTSSQFKHLEGFTTSYGDGGIFTLDGGTAGAAYTVFTPNNGNPGPLYVVGMELKNNGASGGSTSTHGVSVAQPAAMFFHRCVFRDLRGSGIGITGGSANLTECEFYGCNQANVNGCGGVRAAGGMLSAKASIFHDNAGANNDAVHMAGGYGVLSNCVMDTNGRAGLNVQTNSGVSVDACDFYNNATGIDFNTVGGTARNCNFVKNTTAGVNGGATSTAGTTILFNCGFGRGTQANGSDVANSQSVTEVGSIAYAANATPWVDPANGDFRTTLDAAKFAGRGQFLQTAAGYAGTVGYPSVGASAPQHGIAPSAGDVRSGATVNGVAGTLALPGASSVLFGVQYGAGGTEFTGEYKDAGGGLGKLRVGL